MKLDILAVGVHPDDVELSCSGTLVKHIAMGKSVGLLDLTQGELGTRGSADIRMQEAEAAMRYMKAACRVQLQFKDGAIENNFQHQQAIIECIREYRPDIVLCNAPEDRHPDHGRAAGLVADACFYSGLPKRVSHRNGIAQAAWRPKAVYHYIQDVYLKPDFVIDVTAFIEQKRALITCFKSQFYNPQSTEPETPISSPFFLQSIESKMALYGRALGVAYAEGFITRRYPGVNTFSDLI